MRSGLTALFFAVLLSFAGAAASASDVYINLGGKTGDARLALGLPPFIAADPGRAEDALLARQMQEVIRQDLLFSRYFTLLERGPHFNGTNLRDIAREWNTSGAGWLLTAKFSQAGPKISLTVSLFNLNSSELVFERYYRHDAVYLRAISHRVADDIVLALTGKTGIAHTRIAFSNNHTGNKEIYLIDYDGVNLRRLTRDESIDLLPRFSPNAKQIAYTSYKEGNPDLFLLDIEHNKSRVLSNEQGLNLAGGFSPDGTQLLMTLSLGKNPNLFVKSISDGSLTRLTQHFGVDASPTFSPDASQVAFVSDRSGNPQVYTLNMTTQRPKRLTQTMNWCDSPAWSPTGEWIAFAGRAHQKDKIDIFLVDVTGNQIRQLTHGEGSNEDPSWSPDGRFIAFTSTRNKRSELFLMDADGSAPHKIAEIPGGVFTPHWSN